MNAVRCSVFAAASLLAAVPLTNAAEPFPSSGAQKSPTIVFDPPNQSKQSELLIPVTPDTAAPVSFNTGNTGFFGTDLASAPWTSSLVLPPPNLQQTELPSLYLPTAKAEGATVGSLLLIQPNRDQTPTTRMPPPASRRSGVEPKPSVGAGSSWFTLRSTMPPTLPWEQEEPPIYRSYPQR